MAKNTFIPASQIQPPVLQPTRLAACIRLALVGGILIGSMEQAQAATPALPTLPVPAGKDFVKFGQADLGIKGNALNIHQKSDKAILHWNSFNIGAKNQVNFQQPKTTSIALNRIFQNDASKILGQLNANGQVYLVNQNGFVFGKGSSVNMHTLVASTLDINDDVFKGVGITKAFTETDPLTGQKKAALEGAHAGKTITIENGAKITAADGGRLILAAPEVNNAGELGAGKGGQIMLVASEDKVYLSEALPDSQDRSSSAGLLVEVGTGGKVKNLGNIMARQGNITLAGFAVNQEGRVTATTSSKVNGSIRLQAREGADLNQVIVQPTTSGTVRYNSAGEATDQAKVTFGVNSLTQIGIDQDGPSSVDDQAQPQSTISVSAHTIEMKQNAAIVAPGAKVALTAAGNPVEPKKSGYLTDKFGNQINDETTGSPIQKPLEGKIILGDGASIDVSGAKNITAPVTRNIVDVPVQSYELRNAPLQKDGVLKGQTVRVDFRKKPAIVDISGAEKRIERSTQERLAKQLTGQVNLTAAGEVDVNPGARIDISGGKVTYQGGVVETTKLMTDNGQIVDISEADPNLHYQSVLGGYEEVHQKWGVTKVWQSGLAPGLSVFEPGYVEGFNAGELNIATPKLFWHGDLLAGSVSGPYQRDASALPSGGKWTINNGLTNSENDPAGEAFSFTSKQNLHFQRTDNKLQLRSGATQPNAEDLVLGTEMINRSGIQTLTVKTAGNASMDADASLLLPVKGSVELVARNIDVAGKIHAAGGNVNLAAGWNQGDADISLSGTGVFENPFSQLLADDGQLNIKTGAALHVSGRWVNDFATSLTGALATEPKAIEGGSIQLTSGMAGIRSQSGSVIKADGGANLSSRQQLEAGKGGQVSFETHRQINVPDLNGEGHDVYPNLQLDGTLSAYGLSEGGTLSIKHETGNFLIGQPDASDSLEHSYVLSVTNKQLDINGIASFSNIQLNNNFPANPVGSTQTSAGLNVTKSTTIELKQQNLLLSENFQQQASTDSLSALSTVTQLPDYLRKPVDLTLASKTDLLLDTGSQILADPLAVISLKPATEVGSIFVDGLISAPGGSINASFKQISTDSTISSPHHIWLGRHAELNVAGTTRFNPPDSLSRRTGEVLAGGTINLLTGPVESPDAAGHVIIEQGAKLDVSGTQAILDLPDASPDGGHTAPTLVASDAGRINIKASESIVLDGDLTANAGSGSTSGGRLNLALVDYAALVHPHQFIISQNYQRKLGSDSKFSDLFDPSSMFSYATQGLVGTAQLSSNQIQAGGFSDLKLATNSSALQGGIDASDATTEGKITFAGDVKLTVPHSIELDSAKIDWSSPSGSSHGAVTLNTALLKAGSSLAYKVDSPPTAGGGVLTANTQWTELNGASTWSGFTALSFNSRHDTRAIGYNTSELDAIGTQFNTAGNINLIASQLYPTTLSNFSFTIDPSANPNGKIAIASSGLTDTTPLSAGGVLNFNAPLIQQDGILKAPFGNIKLMAGQSLTLGSGNITSVSGAGLLVPFGNILNGQNWIYPGRSKSGDCGQNCTAEQGNVLQLVTAPPEKKLTLSAPEIKLEKGSTVDLAGGGDLTAAEFQPGIGGDFNYLGTFIPSEKGVTNPSYQRGFAVLPRFKSGLAPYDPLQQNLGNYAYETGKQVYLNGSDKLAAGFYTILPARYALMPGAYLITPRDSTQDQHLTSFTSSGLPVVGGYVADAGTGTRDQRWSAYLIEDGKDIRRHSQYDERTANTFFAQAAVKKEQPVPFLPEDGGQLVLKGAKTRLALDGDLKVAPEQHGRGARLDITGEQIRIVNALSATPPNDALEIVAGKLSGLGAGSLLLGGERSIDPVTGHTNLTVSAKEVTVGNGAFLTGTDIIIAAQDKVSVLSGAKLQVSGQVNTGDKTLNIINANTDPNADPSQPISNDGALLRLSADNQVSLIRANAPGNAGELQVAHGASLSASKSMLLDASSNVGVDGDLVMKGGALSLNANTINLGELGNVSSAGALNLGNSDLAKLTVDEFVLNSRGALNLYGNVGNKDSSGHYQPLNFNKLVANALGINGFGSPNSIAQLSANELLLQNPSAKTLEHTGTGTGQLKLSADNFQQGRGNFSISGFKSVGIDATEAFKAVGNGSLNVAGDLNLNAGYLTAASGVSMDIKASGNANLTSNVAKAILPDIGDFGGAIAVNAASVNFDARAILPSGTLALHSTSGSTLVNGHAMIDLAGRKVAFADTADYTPGGTLKAIADKGNIVLAKGATVDVRSGGGNEASGKLIFQAANELQLLGTLNAQGGSAALEVGGFGGKGGFDTLMDKLMASGVSDSLSVRSRLDDIQQDTGHSIHANSIKLAADKGNLSIAGTLDASGKTKGGNIELYAGDRITLENQAVVSTQGKGASARGGDMLLSATDSDRDGISGITINLDTKPHTNSKVDVSGGASGQGGDVVLRALRQGKDGIAIDKINGLINGFRHFYAEGVKIYRKEDLGNDGSIDTVDITKIQQDTSDYMALDTIKNVSKVLGNKDIQLRPGVEIDYDGDLALKDEWNLLAWRYPTASGTNPVAGSLGIHASGDLNFQNSLSDDFVSEAMAPTVELKPLYDEFGNPVLDEFQSPKYVDVSTTKYLEKLQGGNSWSYRLSAGADLAAADSGTTGVEAKNLAITQKTGASAFDPLNRDLALLSTVIRTGSGNIALSASGNVVFADGKLMDADGQTVLDTNQDPVYDPNTSLPMLKPITFSTSIYTAGSGNTGETYGSDPIDPTLAAGYVDYPQGGGNVSIDAGQDVKGSLYQKPQISDWLVVQGISTQTDEFGNPLPNDPTSWGVDFAKFGQNIGAFGGGSIDIQAGRNIDDLAVMAPTTGRQEANTFQVNGADRLQVSAGNDINGGIYLLGQGEATLTAGGTVAGTTRDHSQDLNPDQSIVDSMVDLTAGPQILLGDTAFNLRANRGAAITGVTDPILADTDGNTRFFSYSSDSAFSIKALAGDIKLASDTAVYGIYTYSPVFVNPNVPRLSPGSYFVTAFGGNILNNDAMQGTGDTGGAGFIVPSASGNVAFLAKQNIDSQFNMLDFDPKQMPNPLQPLSGSAFDSLIPSLNGTFINYAQTPVHRGDHTPVRLVANNGDISGGFTSSKRAVIYSGRDIKASITLQHANSQGDVSIISAGRDLDFTSEADQNTGEFSASGTQISVGGPGEALITAGRNIDLGTSGGIVTNANLDNPNLPDAGANLTVMAGLHNTAPNYLGFEKLDQNVLDYAENYNRYQDAVIALMRERTGNTKMTAKTAFELFKGLSKTEIEAFNVRNSDLKSNTYRNKIAEMKQEISQFMRTRENNSQLAEDKALTGFKKLGPSDYLPIQSKLTQLANAILFSELNATGSASAADPSVGNKRGYDAIQALFPGAPGTSGAPWQGDISLAFSQVKTEKGGDINLLARGGNIDVGLPVPGVQKTDDQLGVIARDKGNVNLFLDGNLNVNQSRVFALGGDDITVWSSHGDIDAGRGAKSAFAVSEPSYQYDGNGNLITSFLPPVAGSGIRTAAPPNGGNAKAGDLGLYAPGGVVNAAEAGIGGNNVTISATAVLGANNIQVGGVGTGVPAATTVSLAAGLTGASNVAANATQAAQDAASMDKDRMDDAKNGKQKQLGTISVELIGFGA